MGSASGVSVQAEALVGGFKPSAVGTALFLLLAVQTVSVPLGAYLGHPFLPGTTCSFLCYLNSTCATLEHVLCVLPSETFHHLSPTHPTHSHIIQLMDRCATPRHQECPTIASRCYNGHRLYCCCSVAGNATFPVWCR